MRHPIAKHKCFSSLLAVVFAQTSEARCEVENEDAPTTSEWSTILLPTKVRLILKTLRYISCALGDMAYWQSNMCNRSYTMCTRFRYALVCCGYVSNPCLFCDLFSYILQGWSTGTGQLYDYHSQCHWSNPKYYGGRQTNLLILMVDSLMYSWLSRGYGWSDRSISHALSSSVYWFTVV